MKVLFVGYKNVNIERGAESVKGTSLFFNLPLKAESSAGYEIDKAWATSENEIVVPSNVNDYLGEEVDISYNRRGKIESVAW